MSLLLVSLLLVSLLLVSLLLIPLLLVSLLLVSLLLVPLLLLRRLALLRLLAPGLVGLLPGTAFGNRRIRGHSAHRLTRLRLTRLRLTRLRLCWLARLRLARLRLARLPLAFFAWLHHIGGCVPEDGLLRPLRTGWITHVRSLLWVCRQWPTAGPAILGGSQCLGSAILTRPRCWFGH
ncbi:MAG: hypothetical protein KJO07_13485, partial [Deltaproteobacteria bacterium]|nr:hypothetical protein [Deltaproteobacteria bacterium]